MRPLLRIVVGLVLLAGVLSVGALFLAPAWEVSRSVVVEAPVEAVHPWIADPALRLFWSLEALDAYNMVTTAEDPARGVWLDLRLGSEPVARCVFLYEAADAGTQVTWTVRDDAGDDLLLRWVAVIRRARHPARLDAGLVDLKTAVEGGTPEAESAARAFGVPTR